MNAFPKRFDNVRGWLSLPSGAFLLGTIQALLLRAFFFLQALPANIRTYFIELPEKPALRYKTVLVCMASLFVSLSILSNANPFRLFWPGFAFPLPPVETRKHVGQLGLGRANQNLVSFERALSLNGGLEKRALQSLQLVGLPLDQKDSPQGANFIELEPLPRFSYAIKQIWFRKENGTLLIDLRRQTLDDELDVFFVNMPISDKQRREIADAWFESATASLLVLDSKIKKIEFRLDGQLQKWSALHFDLTRTYRTKSHR